MTSETTQRVLVTRVGLTTGNVLCRHCPWEGWYFSPRERRRTMGAVRSHLRNHPTHVVDLEDAHQTTVEVAGMVR